MVVSKAHPVSGLLSPVSIDSVSPTSGASQTGSSLHALPPETLPALPHLLFRPNPFGLTWGVTPVQVLHRNPLDPTLG